MRKSTDPSFRQTSGASTQHISAEAWFQTARSSSLCNWSMGRPPLSSEKITKSGERCAKDTVQGGVHVFVQGRQLNNSSGVKNMSDKQGTQVHGDKTPTRAGATPLFRP